MTSTRLPGKVLMLVEGKPLLQYHLERLCEVSLADELIVATTENKTDDPIVDLCNSMKVKYFRGSEDDVLSRYFLAAKKYKANVVVRVTSDCPLIDPAVVDKVINAYLIKYPQYQYVSNVEERTYPRGMDTEVFSYGVLNIAHKEATAQPDREHVTPYITNDKKRFKKFNVKNKKNQSKYRWTVDTKEDFDLISKMILSLNMNNNMFNMNDYVNLCNKNPDWLKINAHIEQKSYGE